MVTFRPNDASNQPDDAHSENPPSAGASNSPALPVQSTTDDTLHSQLVSDQPATARVGHDQIVRDVNLFTAKRFLDEQDDLLHQTVNFLFSPGIGGTGKNALQERSPFKEYYYALREGLIILIKRFEDFEQQARTLLETNYPEQVSLLIEDTFYPLVDDMETFFERLYATNVRMYLTWRDSGGEADHMSRYIPLQIVPSEEDERLMLYVPEDPWAGVDEEDPRGEASAIKRQYQRIASRFRGLVCNLNRKAAVVDLNGAVLDYLDQYLSHLSGVDSGVDPPPFSHLGYHLINKKGIGHFRKQF